jgi:3-oxocholest-4-en-26-oate---CoA ligase
MAQAEPALHVASVLEEISDAIPDATALVWRDVRRDWRDFDARAARLATVLSRAGLCHNSPVALYMHNSPAYLEGYYATLKMRGIPVNANYRYVAEELLYLLENCDAEAIIYDEELAPRVAAIAHRAPHVKLFIEAGRSGAVKGSLFLEDVIAANAPMERISRDPSDLMMTYTGGTTGMPKGVMRPIGPFSHGIMVIAARALGAEPPQTPAEAARQARRLFEANALPVSVVTPPFMHGTGMTYGAQVPLMAGGRVVMLPSRSFSPAEALRVIEAERATSLTIAGDVIARPLSIELERAAAAGEPYDIKTIKTVYSAGMIWTAGTKRIILDHAPHARLIDVVGSSEGHIGTSYATRGNVPDTGVFTPNPTTKVLKEDGSEVVPGSGERGMLACTGATVAGGYHKDPEKSAKTYKQIDGVSYAMAGDWATIERDGSIRFLGRDSSCINTGGEKVFAEEVENLILRMPGVADCIVIGVPDERWGQIVGAVVAPLPNARIDEQSVKDWVRTELAGYKVPRRLLFLEKVPRSPNGKSDLAGARDLLVKSALEPAPAL